MNELHQPSEFRRFFGAIARAIALRLKIREKIEFHPEWILSQIHHQSILNNTNNFNNINTINNREPS
jgi:hypothetical protein